MISKVVPPSQGHDRESLTEEASNAAMPAEWLKDTLRGARNARMEPPCGFPASAAAPAASPPPWFAGGEAAAAERNFRRFIETTPKSPAEETERPLPNVPGQQTGGHRKA